MTREDLIKALKCCGDASGSAPCDGCPLVEIDDCVGIIMRAAADLLERDAEQLGEFAPRPMEAPAALLEATPRTVPVRFVSVKTVVPLRDAIINLQRVTYAAYDEREGCTYVSFASGDCLKVHGNILLKMQEAGE